MTGRTLRVDHEAFHLSPFMLEWLAGNKSPVQLPIASVCNGRCLFCSNQLNPFPVFGGAFREIEDIRLQLCAMTPHDLPIRLSDSLPGRISEGEALLHPRLFEILEIIRKRFFYNTLCFTTNASMLTEDFVGKLAAFRPIEINVSLHSTVPRVWAKVFSLRDRDAETAFAALPLLARSGIELIGTIVPLPNVCGWDDIERSYDLLVEHKAKRMVLYWPGFTLRTPEAAIKDLECPIEAFSAFAERMKSRHPVPLDAFPDMVSEIRVAVGTIMGKTLRGNPATHGGAYRRVVWLASRAAFARLEEMVLRHRDGYSNRHHVVAADNLSYRGNIIAAGLLMVEDLIRAGRTALELWPDTELFLVPAEPFDSLLRDLSGVPAYRIADSLNVATWIAQGDGTIDPLLSMRLTRRRKAPDEEIKKTMDRFSHGGSDDGAMDERLRLVAAYPLPTGWGPLGREELKRRLREEGRRVQGRTPLSQSFEILDGTRALCIETWSRAGADEPLRRWTRLVKIDRSWRIESIEESPAPASAATG